MTLVLTALGRESVWMVTDRRLTVGSRVVTEEAIKVVDLGTSNGRVLIGYAGIGATAKGTQPSDWIVALLRGARPDLAQALSHLARAAERQLPPHLKMMRGGSSHVMLIAGFEEAAPKVFAIAQGTAADRTPFALRYEQVFGPPRANGKHPTPRIASTGTGTPALWANKKAWMRKILRLISRHESGDVSSEMVATELAGMNFYAHERTDGTVGPNCLVVWRYRNGAVIGGGAQQAFEGLRKAKDPPIIRKAKYTPIIPAVDGGYDVGQLVKLTMESTMPTLVEAIKTGTPPRDTSEEMKAAVARGNWERDERLK